MSEFPATLGESNATADAEPTVVVIGDDRADGMFEALSSETARGLFQRLQDSPAPASTLAEHTDTSVQNAHYHLEKLEAAEAVEVVDTAYSPKGREMDVYAPTASPLVFVADGDDGVAESLSTFLGALGLLALGSVLVQALVEALFYPGGPTPVDGGGSYAAPPLTNVAPPVGVYLFAAGLVLLVSYALFVRRDQFW
ncbi:MAG: ArsR/SmtB family transcription factor [Halolamina sp.]